MKAWHYHARLILPVEKIEHDGNGEVRSVHLTCGRHTIVAPGSSVHLVRPTGMLDKYGREIHDGDIVYITFYGFTRVYWSEEHSTWTTDLCGVIRPTLESFPGYLVMVAGNIWQTPELDAAYDPSEAMEFSPAVEERAANAEAVAPNEGYEAAPSLEPTPFRQELPTFARPLTALFEQRVARPMVAVQM